MKNGVCPKCGSNQIYRAQPRFSQVPQATLAALRLSNLEVYTCLACGLVETYMPPTLNKQEIQQAWEYVGASVPLAAHSPADAQTTIRLPPKQFGAASVLAYGTLDRSVPTTAGQPFHYVAFCQQPHDADIHRYYCDARWSILQKDTFPSMAAAVAALELDYQGAAQQLIALRSQQA